jgi:SAM-dependent methyltransferase
MDNMQIQAMRIKETLDLIPSGVVSVLDVGCNEGSILASLVKYFYTCGIDISFDALKKVQTNCILASIADLPFLEKSFDLLICTEVLEHLLGDVYTKAISEIQRVARKYIIISVPNEESLFKGTARCHFCLRKYHISGHVRVFDSNKLCDLFDGTQFVIQEIKGVGNRSRHSLRMLYFVLQRLGNKWAHSHLNICPHCGKHNEVPWKGNSIAYAVERLIWFIEVHFPSRRPRPAWLICLCKNRLLCDDMTEAH